MKDIVLDTDAYNEIDDQYAIAYLLRSDDQLHTRAIYAAPFSNALAATPKEGMEKSYEEIQKLLKLCNREVPVYKGAEQYLPDAQTPVASPAAWDIIARAKTHTKEDPLYVVAIGAITNVASALLLDPGIADRTVIVWLGGHAHHWHDTVEFNMKQDIAAARVVMNSNAAFVQLPCRGVVSEFATTAPELQALLFDQNPLADYLARNTVFHMEHRKNAGKIWSKPLWDVTAIGWLLNDDNKFMLSRKCPVRLPEYNGTYGAPQEKQIEYVYAIKRDALMADLVEKLTK